ncbi:TIGR02301 family protein [Chelatococcus sp. SYSU_G07232]|uniref:TIGR02301 family protein n=1 Tax=Chelatococcus albus TaxID=3047466 RepID=A0ABT7AEG0_9HYPH|nr:TIGR02301 family protein [Chelatococcus sp. SYSU_G07232]MDJ1157753.1 TIGR02301 family protein [Chelatococcus sp. SYSU_G07232]
MNVFHPSYLRSAARGAAVAAALASTVALTPAAAQQEQQRPASPRSAPAKPAPKAEPNAAAKPGARPGPSSNSAPEQPPAEPAPPYEREMLRLSEIMGALAFLRGLCGGSDAPQWRAEMTALLEAEATTPARRERLAGAYNRGYKGFALTYRSCTPSAQAVIDRYLAEGAALSRAISGRFGG